MSEERRNKGNLRERTKAFALRVIRLYAALPKTGAARVMGEQILRSGTSVGAQYREGWRSRSDAEFVSKLQSGLQELEETQYWMELLVEGGLVEAQRLEGLMAEGDELAAMLMSSVKTVKERLKKL